MSDFSNIIIIDAWGKYTLGYLTCVLYDNTVVKYLSPELAVPFWIFSQVHG